MSSHKLCSKPTPPKIIFMTIEWLLNFHDYWTCSFWEILKKEKILFFFFCFKEREGRYKPLQCLHGKYYIFWLNIQVPLSSRFDSGKRFSLRRPHNLKYYFTKDFLISINSYLWKLCKWRWTCSMQISPSSQGAPGSSLDISWQPKYCIVGIMTIFPGLRFLKCSTRNSDPRPRRQILEVRAPYSVGCGDQKATWAAFLPGFPRSLCSCAVLICKWELSTQKQ